MSTPPRPGSLAPALPLTGSGLPGCAGHGQTGPGLCYAAVSTCAGPGYPASSRCEAGTVLPGTLAVQNGGGTRRNSGAAANGPCLSMAGGSGGTN